MLPGKMIRSWVGHLSMISSSREFFQGTGLRSNGSLLKDLLMLVIPGGAAGLLQSGVHPDDSWQSWDLWQER